MKTAQLLQSRRPWFAADPVRSFGDAWVPFPSGSHSKLPRSFPAVIEDQHSIAKKEM